MVEGGAKKTLSYFIRRARPFWGADKIMDINEKMSVEGILTTDELSPYTSEMLEDRLKQANPKWSDDKIDAACDTLAAFLKEQDQPAETERKQRSRSRDRSRKRSPSPRSPRGRNGRRCGRHGGGNRKRGQSRGSGGSHNNNDNHNHRKPREQAEKSNLWLAAEVGDLIGARQTLDARGCTPDDTYQGWTPLMKAAEEGYEAIVKMLVDSRVNLEEKNKKGRTALSFAAAPSMKRATPTETLRYLLTAGASQDATDDQGRTARDHATQENRSDAIAVFDEYDRM